MATDSANPNPTDTDLLNPEGADPDASASKGYEVAYDKTAHVITSHTEVPTPQGQQLTRTIETEANLLLEYVAALGTAFAPWLATGYIRQLPNPSDELMADFGARLYEEDMTRDAQVYATLSILVMAVLAEGWRIEPPLPLSDPQYDAAKKISDFCTYTVTNTDRSFQSILFELLEGALKMGHKTGELIWELDPDTPEGAKIVLRNIKTKSHSATAFVVDGFNNVLGLLYIRPGQMMPVLSTIMIGQTPPEGPLPSMVPRSKFVIPANRARNGDPRGVSHLKAVYTPWWQKLQWVPQHVAYVARFAQPSIWIKLPPDAKDIPITDSDGTIVKYKSIVQASNDAGVKLKGGAVATFVNADANMMEAKSDGKVLFDSYEFADRQIAKGILLQTLTTEEGQHMARAASEVHQDVFGIFIASLRAEFEWVIRNEILRKMVLYNFGEKESKYLTPRVSLGDTEQQDVPAFVNALAALALAGGIHPSQWPGLWEKLDFPKVDEEEWKQDQEILAVQRENNLKLAKNPPPPPPVGGQFPPGAPKPPGAPQAPPPAQKLPTPPPSKGPVTETRAKPPQRTAV